MFTIQLQDFRCWPKLTLSFSIGKITLIKGNSGIGKTTIFSAVTWCLYGNLRYVAPNNNDKAKTSVSITFPSHLNGQPGHIHIQRTRNPARLILTHNQQIYEDQVAQSIINNLFGNYDVWLASCYINQGSRNNFLTAPNSGKMELLNTIAFADSDPSVYLQKVDSKITELDKHHSILYTTFTTQLAGFTERLTQHPNPPLTNPDTLHIELNTLQNNLIKWQEQVQERQIQLSILTQYTESYNYYQEQLKTLEPPVGDFNSQTLDQYRQWLPLIQRLEDLHAARIAPVTVTTNFTFDDYRNAVHAEQLYQQMYSLAKSLQVEYNKEELDKAIASYQLLVTCQDMLKSSAEYNILLSKYKQCLETVPESALVEPTITPCTISEPTMYNVEVEQQQLNDLATKIQETKHMLSTSRQALDVLICPHCSQPVKYIQGKLHGENVDLQALNQNINHHETQLTQYEQQYESINQIIKDKMTAWQNARSQYAQQIQAENARIAQETAQLNMIKLENSQRQMRNQQREKDLQYYKQELEKLMPVEITNECSTQRLLSSDEKNRAYQHLTALQSIQILSLPPVSSVNIQQGLAQQEQYAKYIAAEKAYNDYYHSLEARNYTSLFLQSEINRLAQIEQSYLKYEREREKLQQQIEDYRQKIVSIVYPDDPQPQINQAEIRCVEIQQQLEQHRIAIELGEERKRIEKIREEVCQVVEQLTAARKLRQLIIDTECMILQQVVDSINNCIGGVCSVLFENDINIMLSLFRTLKTTNNLKSEVNFTITYQGGSYNNINQLSGGEGDRVSLALTLALHRLSGCPFLMLDESFASLDITTKTNALASIRENTRNTVLIIQHDGVEGIFDDVIDLSTYSL
jgi:DNA repair exonuclease SbcCD ATPase subunit